MNGRVETAHRWCDHLFRVKADGRVGMCVLVRVRRVDGGGSMSRKQPKRKHRPTERALLLQFPDGASAYFSKHELAPAGGPNVEVAHERPSRW